MSTIRIPQVDNIKRVTECFNFAIFWVVKRTREHLTVRTPKSRSDGKHINTNDKQ